MNSFIANLFSLFWAVLFLASCTSQEWSEAPVVVVGDKVLSNSQLAAAVPPSLSSVDSAAYANDYIRNWAFKHVILNKASQYITDMSQIDKAVEEYRTSLIVESFQNKLIDQKFSAVVSDADVEAYYKSMSANFVLNDAILKGVFAIVPDKSPDFKSFMSDLESSNDESAFKVEQYLYKYASNYKVFVDSWTRWASIKKFFPSVLFPENQKFSLAKKVHSYEYEGNVYILKITDVKPSDSVAPLEFVENDIYTILLNKQKLEFLNAASKDIYEQALRDNTIHFYGSND